jgi:hypothetical protein
MSLLQNWIPNPAGRGQWVARPAASTLVAAFNGPTILWDAFNWGTANWGSDWGGIQGPSTISGITTLGKYAFGMIAATSGPYAGSDVPFMYDLIAKQFHNFVIPGGVAALPTTPPAGDWVPPRFAASPGMIVVTHPGFAGGTHPFFGWMDFGGFSDGTKTGNTHTTTTVDGLSSNVLQAGWRVGMTIQGTGIPGNTTIVSIASNGLSLTLSAAATATATGVVLTVAGGTLGAPLWGSGNANGFPLAAVPVDAFNFNGRIYYAVPGNGMTYSDSGAPLQITNATQTLFPNNGLDITCFGGLPINQTQTGPISSLFCFQGDTNIIKVTGDTALSNLLIQSVPNGVGTLAPNTLASTPIGLCFIAPDGLRYIDFDGNASPVVGAEGEGVNLPFINAINPSRMNAAYNEDCYRISVNNGNRATPTWEDYWYHVTRKVFSGPHTDPSGVVAAYQQEAGATVGHGFILTMPSYPATLYLGSTIPNTQARYLENGSILNCIWQTCYSQDNEMLTENSVVESTLLAALPVDSTMGVLVINELGTVLDQIDLAGGPSNVSLWGVFTWAQAKWFGQRSIPFQRDLPWHQPLVYKQMAMRTSVMAGAGLMLGEWHYNNIVLGYRLETFGGYV